MSEWSRIDDLADIRRGASPRPIGDPKYFGGEVGWVRISDVTRASRFLRETEQYVSPLGESLSVRVNPRDLVMSICGTLGRPIIIDMPACIHDGFVRFSNLRDADTCYLFYALQYAEPAFYGMGQPGTQTNLNTGLVGRYKIFAPRIGEQRRIAEILSTVDEAIEQTEALIVKYQQIKAGLMHDLFTRGVTPDGHLRPTRAQAPHLYRESPLGWIPKEWEVGSIGSIAMKIQDGTHFSPVSKDGPCRYITSKNIRFGYMDIEDCGWISQIEHDAIYKRCDVRLGDILLTKDGANTGNACLNELPEEFSMLSSVALIRMDEVSAHGDFVLHYLLSPSGQQRLKDLMTGNAITRLTLQKINAFLIPVAQGAEQRRIADRLNATQCRILSEESELRKLRQQKHGLMQDLLTGHVRVKVAQAASV